MPAVLAYTPALLAGFVWDDFPHVAENARIERFSDAFEYFAHPEGRYHRPLVFLSYAIDHAIWGRAAGGYHATNIALHLLNMLLLARALRRGALAPTVILAAVALFGVHPVQSEAVAYVSGRTDLLMTSGALTAWLVLFGSGSASRRGALVALAAAWAALSKESGYALALLVPWLAWGRERELRARLALALPSVVVLAGILLLRPGTAIDVGDWNALGSRLAGVGRAMAGYATLLVWPSRLIVDRLTELPVTWPAWMAGMATIFAAAALVGVGLRGSGRVAEWTAWSAAFYLPVANLIPLYPAIAATALFTPEHNLYPVMAGLAALAAIAFDHLRARAAAVPARVLRFVSLAVLVALGVRTALRAADWRDERRLFGAAVATGSRSPRVHYNYGNALLARGDLEPAGVAFESALGLAPRDGQAWANLSVVRQRQGKLDDALAAAERAAALLEGDPLAWENLGTLRLASGDYAAARTAFAEAVRLDPGRRRAGQALRALDELDAGR